MKTNVLRISEVKILVPRSNLQATLQRQEYGQACLVFKLSSETAAPGKLQRGEKQQWIFFFFNYVHPSLSL